MYRHACRAQCGSEKREEEEECYLWEFPWDTAQGRGDRGACGKTAGTKAGTNRVLRRGKNETNISSPLLQFQQPSFSEVHPILRTHSHLLQLRTNSTDLVQLLPSNALTASVDSTTAKAAISLILSPAHSIISPPYLSVVFQSGFCLANLHSHGMLLRLSYLAQMPK